MASYSIEKDDMPTKLPKEEKKSFFGFLKKGGLKSLILILILLVVAVMLFNFSDNNSIITSSSETNNKITYTTSLDYIKEIEGKLNEVVGSIKGAGNVRVMISIDSSPELSIAETVESKVTSVSGGTATTTTSEPIIVEVNGEESPLILKETLPVIKGVIVVSSGASDTKVRLDILNAVVTALGINSNKVEVFVGE